MAKFKHTNVSSTKWKLSPMSSDIVIIYILRIRTIKGFIRNLSPGH